MQTTSDGAPEWRPGRSDIPEIVKHIRDLSAYAQGEIESKGPAEWRVPTEYLKACCPLTAWLAALAKQSRDIVLEEIAIRAIAGVLATAGWSPAESWAKAREVLDQVFPHRCATCHKQADQTATAWLGTISPLGRTFFTCSAPCAQRFATVGPPYGALSMDDLLELATSGKCGTA